MAMRGTAKAPADLMRTHAMELASAPRTAIGTPRPRVVPACWSQWRHDAAHTGWNPAETAINLCNVASLSVLWSRQLEPGPDSEFGGIYGDVVSFGGALYARTGAGTICKLALDGTIVWTYASDVWVVGSLAVGTLPGSSAPFVFFTKFVGASSGVFALADAGDAAVRVWYYPTGSYVASPTLAGDTLYVADGEAGLISALGAHDGSLRWSVAPAGQPVESEWLISATPTVASGLVYVGDQHGELFALATDTGATAWRVAVGGEITGTPAVDHGTVFFTSQYSDPAGAYAVCFALDAETGQQRWKSAPLPPAQVHPYYASSVGLAYGLVFVPSGGGVVALSHHSGHVGWQNPGASPTHGSSSVTVANGLVYTALQAAGNGPGGFAVYDAHTGHQLLDRPGEAPTDVYSSATVAGGRMYLGTGGAAMGSVVAYAPS